MSYLLAIDQGTTSSRAVAFDHQGSVVAQAQYPFQQYFPQNGWVEHDLEEIWSSTYQSIQDVFKQVGQDNIVAAGITNQRETTCLWHRETGEAVHRAIVWQDRRTAAACQDKQFEKTIQQKTGLLLDPYFSATKIAWVLAEVPKARAWADAGQLCFGTIDSYLIWRLTKGQQHLTDATNASRTLLFNIHTQEWDDALCHYFDVPKDILPTVKDCVDDFGCIDKALFGRDIPITAVAGDQHAALIGQACTAPGHVKSTYGTGCFMMMHTGVHPKASHHRLLTTVALRLNGTPTYALEGSIFIAGAAIQWLRDSLKLFSDAKQTESIAQSVPDSGGVIVVPALTGLGAPHWCPDARGAILGMTRDTTDAHIVRATLESITYQTKDLIQAFTKDSGESLTHMGIDGGMVANTWFCQLLSNVLGVGTIRPKVIETTALGAAFLAGLGANVFSDLSAIDAFRQVDTSFAPQNKVNHYQAWQKAVEAVKKIGILI